MVAYPPRWMKFRRYPGARARSEAEGETPRDRSLLGSMLAPKENIRSVPRGWSPVIFSKSPEVEDDAHARARRETRDARRSLRVDAGAEKDSLAGDARDANIVSTPRARVWTRTRERVTTDEKSRGADASLASFADAVDPR